MADGDSYYGEAPYGGAPRLTTAPSPPTPSSAGFTGRLGNPFALPGHIMLGHAGVVVTPPPGLRPWPDMPTALELARHVTAASVFHHRALLSVSRRTTVVRPDAAPPD